MAQDVNYIKPFLDENFLLENRTAEILFHEYAAQQPIIDYHNHLPPKEIAEDARFENITAAWLAGDHYKWRAMRTAGVPERFITGDATDFEKFQHWAATVPLTARNPLFHWAHLELRRYFDIQDLLNPNSAERIYHETTAALQSTAFSAQSLLRKMNVELLCTTDDPTDDLQYHRQFVQAGAGFRLLPAFRPDRAIFLEKTDFPAYIQQLGSSANVDIHSFASLLEALQIRLEFFHQNGCKLSDHGLEQPYADDFTEKEVNAVLAKRLAGMPVTASEARKYKSALLYHLCLRYAEKGWVQQFHLGALRNNNSRLFQQLGPDTGFDSIGDWSQAEALSSFLNRLDAHGHLAKTILYNLNPKDNEVMATMAGNFNSDANARPVRGKVQFGSAWWFLDQKDGMEKQLNALSNMGLLSCFVGMLTDSRSFLSFPRHEYFRRILCNLIGRDVHRGELPNDTAWLGGIVVDVCYRNAKNYFGFDG
jgi:glucuronate isomerase